MSLWNLIGITAANATPAAGQHAGGAASMLSPLIFIVLIFAVMYFMVIRPQGKRRKDQQKLLSDVKEGDEIVTIGGIVGRVSKMRDDFIELTVAKDTTITMQKNSVANVLPKGTFES